MRFLQPSRITDLEQSFDRAYPILAAMRRANARLVGECEQAYVIFDSFSRAVVDPLALELDRSGFDNPARSLEPILREACRRKLFSLALPRSLGGQGLPIVALNIGLERLARSCLGVANLLAVHGLALGVLGAAGALAQLRQIAMQIVEGEKSEQPFLLSTAATEPDAGTDVEDVDLLKLASLRCEAKKVQNGYKISGSKIFVSNGSLATAHVVIAPTDLAQPVETLSAFLVESGRPGFEVVRVEHKLGQRACPAAELRFSDCVIPESHKLNQDSMAGKAMDLILGASRASVAAFGSGVAHAVMDDCRRYLHPVSRSASGKEVEAGEYELWSEMWQNACHCRSSYLDAVMANSCFGLTSLMEVAVLRQLDRFVPPGIGAWATSFRVFDSPLLNREARRWLEHLTQDQVDDASAHASAAKVTCSRLALRNCELAAELLGPRATEEATGIPKRWRDARLLSIYEGTNELNSLDVYKKGVLRD